jgi:hypothetical protein
MAVPVTIERKVINTLEQSVPYVDWGLEKSCEHLFVVWAICLIVWISVDFADLITLHVVPSPVRHTLTAGCAYGYQNGQQRCRHTHRSTPHDVGICSLLPECSALLRVQLVTSSATHSEACTTVCSCTLYKQPCATD